MKSTNLIDDQKLQVILVLIAAAVFFISFGANPSAQTKSQFPAPTGHVNDLAGVLDDQTKQRLENVLENLRLHNKIEFYLALVENTAGQDIFEFSRSLARDWDIGARTSVKKSLLLVVSTNDKSSFTQFSRSVQGDLPDGILGEMSQRMHAPITAGDFAVAINTGIDHFVGSLARKGGLTLQDFETPAAVATVMGTAASTPEPAPVTDATPTATPVAETSLAPTPAADQPVKAVTRNRRDTSAPLKSPTRKVNTLADDEAEAEEVELTLTLPFEPRVAKLKEFLDTHPRSKVRAHATELLISAYAALGDQKLRSADLTGGIELLFLAIEQAPPDMSDKLFSGVISQIPLNLYLRGERAAAFKAAQNIETKFSNDPKRLLAIAGFYLGIEQGDEAARVAAQAVKIAPDMAEAHHALALGLHISLHLDEAMAEYKRALELDPKSKGTRRSLADLSRAAGKPEEALVLYREQLSVEPTDSAARAGLVLSLLELGRREEANTELEAAVKEDPRNLALLTGAAYWFVAHDDSERALEFARQAVAIEPRYTWAQIALARTLVARRQPIEAERALRFAKQYGKFPTLDYELASVLAASGLYDEAVEVLQESFVLKEGKIETHLAGRQLARESGFLELLAPERRGSIFQPSVADTPGNANMLKALLAFSGALNDSAGAVDEAAAVAAAKQFAAGEDDMRLYRQLYAASRLLRKGIGLATVQDLAEAARPGVDTAILVPAVTVAVQADEFRDIRARAIASGGTPNIPEAPRSVLANILRGRIEDLCGWALFNQEKTAEAVEHLKRAASILPEGTPSWRTALWHLGAAEEQSDHKDEALNYYIKSYVSGEPDPVRRQLIEQLYRKVNGSLDGLDQRLGTATSSGAVSSPSPEATSGAVTNSETSVAKQPVSTSPEPSSAQQQIVAAPATVPVAPTPAPSPERTTVDTATPTEPSKQATPDATPSPEATPTPAPVPTPTEEQSLAQATARVRATIKITGRVKDASNKGIENVVVVLISPRGTVLAATTDADGKYSFNVSPSQRNYRLVPSKEGYNFEPFDKGVLAFSDDLKEIDFVGKGPTP